MSPAVVLSQRDGDQGGIGGIGGIGQHGANGGNVYVFATLISTEADGSVIIDLESCGTVERLTLKAGDFIGIEAIGGQGGQGGCGGSGGNVGLSSSNPPLCCPKILLKFLTHE
jgi:hypothetical protein